jgi:CheY-like chemotaxis protein
MSSPRSVLIVEDEPLIAMMLEDFLESLGYLTAGGVDNVEAALARVRQGGFDVVILDVNLRGGAECWPVADVLRAKGIPFILATGGQVDSLPAPHGDVATLTKPFTMDNVRMALEKCIPVSDQPV